MNHIWLLIFVVFNLVATWLDIRTRRIPNWLILAGAGYQLAWLLLATQDIKYTYLASAHLPSLQAALIGLVIGFVVFFPLWRFRAVGAGDVKFIGVLGFFLGPAGLFPALLIGSILAGIHALSAVLLQGWVGARAIWKQPPDIRRGIPYAAYIALGALFGMGWLMFHPEPWLSSL
ncbi:A24 family peptidase [Allopusillimonas soli]|uniref:Prepilin peptidase n=1 Tax=Allopusillimonas soli TaxID=659016 RepID=A0A853FGN4_9BURK|nr:prepilin peptidase [Allopusillimonas soli]NYT38802.1 prepilin peptidase [Allopusillimonas soli]